LLDPDRHHFAPRKLKLDKLKQELEKLKFDNLKNELEKLKRDKIKPDELKRKKQALDREIEDEARFLKSWLENPLKTGAVAPSGKALAARMAAAIDPAVPGPIVELGPGTGPVTQALLARGIDPRRLYLVEYSADFVKLLRQRFPGVNVIQGDAYALDETLEPHIGEPVSSIVSSLPLLTRPDKQRLKLLDIAFNLMLPGSPFVQFTYMNPSPVPLTGDFEAHVSRRVWKNLPPARVWTYRRPPV
jgi:phosphatidylethanolamine/phosphatidyl-N-methylethanolamine N-methyltransferase